MPRLLASLCAPLTACRAAEWTSSSSSSLLSAGLVLLGRALARSATSGGGASGWCGSQSLSTSSCCSSSSISLSSSRSLCCSTCCCSSSFPAQLQPGAPGAPGAHAQRQVRHVTLQRHASAAAAAPLNTGVRQLQRTFSSWGSSGMVHSAAASPSGSHASGSSASSSAGASASPGGEAKYDVHPLPSYPIDEEEQQSLDKAIAVINKLTRAGYKALIVGGWVRDKFLARRASDIDIATNATPAELRSHLGPVIELPRSTVKLTHAGEVLELSCFKGISRAASLFGVAMDAVHRDFTINALYYDPDSRQVLDFVGGVPDAAARVLRLTGDDGARLREDPLRVLRGVRLAATLGLRLAPGTARALQSHAHLCAVSAGLPARRIWLELRKLHRAEHAQPGTWLQSLKLSYHLGLLQRILPWLAAEPAAAQQAVRVASVLSRQWAGQGVPLSLLVASTVPPAGDLRQAQEQLACYFQEPEDQELIHILLTAAELVHGAGSWGPARGGSRAGSSSRTAGGAAAPDPWLPVYAHESAQACLQVLAAWLPDALASGFMQHHQARMVQQAEQIAQQRRSAQAGQPHATTAAPGTTTSSGDEAVAARRKRQMEELGAAIAALGDQAAADRQQQQQQLERV